MMLIVIFISLITTYYPPGYFEDRRDEKNCLTAAIEMHRTERKRKGGYSVFPLFLLLSERGCIYRPEEKEEMIFLTCSTH